MDNKDVRSMGAAQIASAFEHAARMQMRHEAITYEHGAHLVNIIGAHGIKLADLLLDGLKYREGK